MIPISKSMLEDTLAVDSYVKQRGEAFARASVRDEHPELEDGKFELVRTEVKKWLPGTRWDDDGSGLEPVTEDDSGLVFLHLQYEVTEKKKGRFV